MGLCQALEEDASSMDFFLEGENMAGKESVPFFILAPLLFHSCLFLFNLFHLYLREGKQASIVGLDLADL